MINIIIEYTLSKLEGDEEISTLRKNDGAELRSEGGGAEAVVNLK